jgi:hypothetical protein
MSCKSQNYKASSFPQLSMFSQTINARLLTATPAATLVILNAMSPSTLVLALTSALLGLTSHLTYFIHSHHPFYHCTFIALTFLLCPIISLVFLTRIASFPLREALRLVAVTWWSFTGSIWLSMGIYRLFFHRLRRYPGPFLAKLSQVWWVWRNLREQNYLVLDELHRTYGEYVRVGMYVLMN